MHQGSVVSKRKGSASLSAWLGAGSAVIVLLAVFAVAASSVDLLGRLADQQAMTRVELAGASAREYLRRLNEEVLSDARVLGERPTLNRLLRDGDRRALEPFLGRYAEASRLFACAVLNEQGVIAAAGGAVPWTEVAAARAEQGERFVVGSRSTGLLLSGASVQVRRNPGVIVIALRVVDDNLLSDMREQIGAGVRVTSYATYVAPPEDPFTTLHTEAISNGRSAVRRMEAGNVYAATVPWFTVTGELIALIDVDISAAEFDTSVRALVWRLVISALVILAIAAAGGMIYGQWLVRPLRTLRAAADRIGRGDFSVAVPSVGISEIEALSFTMDEMRRNLVELTAALRRRDAESRAVLSGVVEGVYAVDENRIIRYANEQMARMLELAPDEIVGRFCGDVLRPEAVGGVRPCDRDCPIIVARGAGQARAAERLCLSGGRARSVVIVSAAPTDGRQVQVLRDETEFESARRARDTVLANISHEFRTPLSAQLASIELLRDGVGRMEVGDQRELLDNLQRGVLRLMRLIDNLLESVRIEAGQLAIRAQTVQLSDVAEEAAELLKPLMAQRRQVLAAEWPSDYPVIVGDAQRLMQVFVNLLANASKFAPEGSTIRVGGHQDGDHVRAWVEDEGPGVGDADPSVVFERFRRSGDIEPDAPGLGLGLWIVRSIVQRHGGTVGVERTSADRTRFYMSLPIGGAP